MYFNSVVSDVKASHVTVNVKNFYLNTPMNRYEYMRISGQQILDDIIQLYKLKSLVVNGFVMVEIRKGMYGLSQAGIIANNHLQNHLAKSNYFPCQTIPSLYKHAIFDTIFTLVVDNFGIKYTSQKNALHSLDFLLYVYTFNYILER